MIDTLLLPETAASLHHITHVYLWSNGMVMVFDQFGQQMPEYQGCYEDVVDKINAAYNSVWYSGNWNAGRVGILSYGKQGEYE